MMVVTLEMVHGVDGECTWRMNYLENITSPIKTARVVVFGV